MPLRRRLALGVAVALVAFAAIELGAWALHWLVTGEPFSWAAFQAARREAIERMEPGEGPARRAPLVVPHPYIGHARNPERYDDVTEFGYPEDTVVPLRRSEDTVLVGVFGGSVATRFARDGMPAVAEALRAVPALAGREFRILNFAGGGIKQPQQLAALAYLLVLGAEFDLVINLDGFNEVALHEPENATKGVFPAFPRGWYALVGEVSSHELRAVMGEVARLEAEIADWAELLSRPPLRHSVVANVVWRARHRRLLAAHYEATRQFQRREVPDASYAQTGPRVEFADDDALYEFLVDVWRRGSLQMHRLCFANGIRYYHFLQPNQYVPGSKKPMGPGERRHAWREDQPYRTGVLKGYPRLRDAGRELRAAGVRFGDLTAIFADVQRPAYWDDCCHLNAFGTAVMGRHVARAILRDFGVEPTDAATGADAAGVSAGASPAPASRD